MAGQRKKSKERVTLNIEGPLLRAIERQAMRAHTDRVKWIIQVLEDRLRDLGKLP